MAEFVRVAAANELGEGEMRMVEVRGTKIAVANVGVRSTLSTTSAHTWGVRWPRGDLEENTVICPCHGSEFDVRSGEVLQGPARESVETYETRVEGGNLEVEG